MNPRDLQILAEAEAQCFDHRELLEYLETTPDDEQVLLESVEDEEESRAERAAREGALIMREVRIDLHRMLARQFGAESNVLRIVEALRTEKYAAQIATVDGATSQQVVMAHVFMDAAEEVMPTVLTRNGAFGDLDVDLPVDEAEAREIADRYVVALAERHKLQMPDIEALDYPDVPVLDPETEKGVLAAIEDEVVDIDEIAADFQEAQDELDAELEDVEAVEYGSEMFKPVLSDLMNTFNRLSSGRITLATLVTLRSHPDVTRRLAQIEDDEEREACFETVYDRIAFEAITVCDRFLEAFDLKEHRDSSSIIVVSLYTNKMKRRHGLAIEGE